MKVTNDQHSFLNLSYLTYHPALPYHPVLGFKMLHPGLAMNIPRLSQSKIKICCKVIFFLLIKKVIEIIWEHFLSANTNFDVLKKERVYVKKITKKYTQRIIIFPYIAIGFPPVTIGFPFVTIGFPPTPLVFHPLPLNSHPLPPVSPFCTNGDFYGRMKGLALYIINFKFILNRDFISNFFFCIRNLC